MMIAEIKSFNLFSHDYRDLFKPQKFHVLPDPTIY